MGDGWGGVKPKNLPCRDGYFLEPKQKKLLVSKETLIYYKINE